MTVDRAIEILTPGNICRNPSDYKEAHRMAIDALRKQEAARIRMAERRAKRKQLKAGM